jgi:hypothetical protein
MATMIAPITVTTAMPDIIATIMYVPVDAVTPVDAVVVVATTALF